MSSKQPSGTVKGGASSQGSPMQPHDRGRMPHHPGTAARRKGTRARASKQVRGTPANYLLGFESTPPRSSQPRRTRGGSDSQGYWSSHASRHSTPASPALFLQSQYRYFVNDTFDLGTHLNDPDKLVDWSCIEEVAFPTSISTSCPICLYPPLAAKLSKCGHIFCWACILRYLTLADGLAAKCPICTEPIQAEDLKSVHIQLNSPIAPGSSTRFILVARPRGSVACTPLASPAPPPPDPELPPLPNIRSFPPSSSSKPTTATTNNNQGQSGSSTQDPSSSTTTETTDQTTLVIGDGEEPSSLPSLPSSSSSSSAQQPPPSSSSPAAAAAAATAKSWSSIAAGSTPASTGVEPYQSDLWSPASYPTLSGAPPPQPELEPAPIKEEDVFANAPFVPHTLPSTPFIDGLLVSNPLSVSPYQSPEHGLARLVLVSSISHIVAREQRELLHGWEMATALGDSASLPFFSAALGDLDRRADSWMHRSPPSATQRAALDKVIGLLSTLETDNPLLHKDLVSSAYLGLGQHRRHQEEDPQISDTGRFPGRSDALLSWGHDSVDPLEAQLAELEEASYQEPHDDSPDPLQYSGPNSDIAASPPISSPQLATKAGKGARDGGKHQGPASMFYFYQADDGQRAYLHPLCVKMLKADFGSYDNFPQELTAPVVDVEFERQSEHVRKRHRYLSHLPLTTNFTFAEVDLSGVVSKSTLASAASEIKSRARKRASKVREDTARLNAAHAAERAQWTAHEQAQSSWSAYLESASAEDSLDVEGADWSGRPAPVDPFSVATGPVPPVSFAKALSGPSLTETEDFPTLMSSSPGTLNPSKSRDPPVGSSSGGLSTDGGAVWGRNVPDRSTPPTGGAGSLSELLDASRRASAKKGNKNKKNKNKNKRGIPLSFEPSGLGDQW